MSPVALKERVQARDRLAAQAEQIGLALHGELLQALERGDVPRAAETARRNDAQLRALAENLRIYQAELRAQAEELLAAQQRNEQMLTRFAALFAGLPVGALLVSDGGEVLEFNATAGRDFDLDGRAAASRFLHRLVAPQAYQERVAPALHEARGSGAGRVEDIEFLGAGRRFVGDLHIARLPGLERGGGQFAVVVIDRTDSLQALHALKDASLALAASEAFLADAARVARTGGWELAIRPRRWRWSRELRELLGVPPGEVLAPASLEGLLALTAAHDRPLLAAAFAAAESGQPFDIEIDMLTAAGQRWRARVIGHADGDGAAVPRVSGVFQDISSQHLAHRRIDDLGERLSMANEAGGIGVFDWQRAAGELLLDDRLRALLGLAQAGDPGRADDLPRDLRTLLHDHLDPGARVQFDAALERLLEAQEPMHVELLLANPGGEPERWLHVTARAHADADGRVGRVVGCAWDSSPEHEAARLVAAKEAAEAASRAKSAFLSRMSHELRTPLNAILGFAQLMRMEAEGGDLVLKPHRVALIETAARHLLDLINEVLDVSRVESGRVEVQLERFDLVPVVAEALPLVQGLADRLGVQLFDTLAGGAPCWVMGDRLRLKEVLINLLSNAVKYNRPQGSVEVSAYTEDGNAGTSDEAAVVLKVLDTGVGLDDGQQAQLFQPFNRAGAEASGIEGTGMGLFVCRRFVELMGGRIELKSAPGVGTTVLVRLNAPAR